MLVLCLNSCVRHRLNNLLFEACPTLLTFRGNPSNSTSASLASRYTNHNRCEIFKILDSSSSLDLRLCQPHLPCSRAMKFSPCLLTIALGGALRAVLATGVQAKCLPQGPNNYGVLWYGFFNLWRLPPAYSLEFLVPIAMITLDLNTRHDTRCDQTSRHPGLSRDLKPSHSHSPLHSPRLHFHDVVSELVQL